MNRTLTAICIVIVAVLVVGGSAALSAGSTAPAGLAGVALSHSVGLSWQPVSGASTYRIYRSATATGTQSLVGTVTSPATTYADTSALNDTKYFYAVRSVVSGVESTNSQIVSSTPEQPTCTNSNPIIAENCFAGSGGWSVANNPDVSSGGIDIYATAQSVNQGGSLSVKVNTAANAPYHLEIWRTGYYAGQQGRLFSSIVNLRGIAQPACSNDATTGLIDCSNWSSVASITTSTSWPSGVYILRAVREDTGTDSQTIFIVRNDASATKLVYQVPTNSYEAYNAWGGRSLYDYNSVGNDTVAGTPRAVKVSFDRPFLQPRVGISSERNWFGFEDLPFTSWLESQGYDVSYISDSDLTTQPGLLLNHKAWIGGTHTEYWSPDMRTAVTAARDAGVSLLFQGSNSVYWKVRYEADPVTGIANRVLVCYKSTQSGGPDPSGIPTGTWRDPAGANNPENSLVGEMYVGDNDLEGFPLVVTQSEGKDRVWRNTGLSSMTGASTSIQTGLVNWEWDSPVANGQGPSNLTILSASPVSGNLIQNNGQNTITGTAVSNATKYIAPSGALVVADGANEWELALGANEHDDSELDTRVQQYFVNIFSDMGVSPATPSAGISVTPPAPTAPTGFAVSSTTSGSINLSWNAVSGADGYLIYRTTSPRVGGLPLGTRLTALPIRGTTYSDTGLPPTTSYYYVVQTVEGVVVSASSSELKGTTQALPPLTVPGKLPAPGATGVSPLADVTATFSRAVDSTTVTTSTVTLTAGGNPVPAAMSYDPATFAVTLVPSQQLALSTTYTVTLAASITSSDGVQLGSPVTWTFTTSSSAPAAPTVTSTFPLAAAASVATNAVPTATFSRAMNPSTFTASSFRLTTGGQAVPATISYDSTTNTAKLTPTSALVTGTAYTVTLTTAVAAQDGTPLQSAYSWQFTTGGCPCSLFPSTLAPASQGNAVQDGRTGSGPWSYELGTKIAVTSPEYLLGVRFYKDPLETGQHIGRVWSATGTLLGQVTFTNETASGWQQKFFATPLQLQPGTTYVVSVNANVTFGTTVSGLLTQVVSGPLQSVADGANGVFGSAAGVFPTSSYSTSNYFVDAVVSPNIPLTVATQVPAPNATGVSPSAAVSATFSGPIDPTTLTSSTFTLKNSSGQTIAGTVSYVSSANRAVFTPSATLALNTSYTATLAGSIKTSDDTTSLGTAVTWTFKTATAPPAPPTVTATTPAAGAGGVGLNTTVTATFSKSMDGSSLNSTSVTLRAADGSTVGATVSYDDTSQTVTLKPNALLLLSTTYTATISASAQAIDGTPMAAAVSWQFTTAGCPCALFSNVLTPVIGGLPVQDGRTGTGPFSYEFGVRVTVSQPVYLTSLRFYKDPLETGSHIGRVWTADGTQIAQVAFTNETASGWQQQTLTSPIQLQPGVTYVFSVNANAFFGMTGGVFASPVTSGALQAASGANGVFGAAAGTFPTSTYNSSNYFVDGVVSTTLPFVVSSTSPSAGATGVSTSSSVSVTFLRAADPTTLTSSTFTVADAGGNAVSGSVSYNSGSNTATFTPSSALASSTTYTATVAGSVKAADGTSLGSAATWTFTTAAPAPPPPSVQSTTPASGATSVSPGTGVSASFSRAMDPATLNQSSFTLAVSGGAQVSGTVSYNGTTNVATFTPSAPLALGTTYTATLAGSVSASDGTPLSGPVSWQFTTASCPCSLFSDVSAPASSGNPVQDGRSGTGPFSYEFGIKITVTAPVSLTAIRFYKDALETGTHVGNVWGADGTPLAQVTFTNESPSGWQTQALATPLQLQPGVTYVISINANAFFGVTGGGLASQIVSGPLQSVADGANGVYASTAGTFPSQSWNSSNYFVDGVVG